MSTATGLQATLVKYGDEQYVPVSALQVDHSYQRQPDLRRARKIADHFDPELAGRLIVNTRTDGSYFVADGQHRLIAMRHLKLALAPCVVHIGWTIEREAEVFEELNTKHKNANHYQVHYAALRSGNAEAVEIEAIVRNEGCQLSDHHPKGGDRNHVSAIQSVYGVYRSQYGGPVLLRRTLHLLADVFGDKPRAFDGRIITGLAYFLWRADREEGFDEQHLRKALQPLLPFDILRDARKFRERGQVEYGSIAFCLREIYNKGLRSKRLATWVEIEWGTPSHLYDIARNRTEWHS